MRVRIGLAGAGMVSEFHLRAWRALADSVEIVAIADVDQGKAEARARQFGIPNAFVSVGQMLDQIAMDAVDIMTPSASHATDCLAAADANVAILCQKPLTPDIDSALNLLEGVAGRVRLMVHENWRFRPHYRQIALWLQEGRIGALHGGRLSATSSGLLPDSLGRLPALVRQPFLASLPRLMVGEVLVHHLDIAHWLVSAREVEGARIKCEAPAVMGESFAHIRLRAKEFSGFEVTGDLCSTGATQDLQDSLELSGAAGSISLRGSRLVLDADEKLAMDLDLHANYQKSYNGAIRHFVTALCDGSEFETSATQHLEVLGMVDQIYRISAATAYEGFAA